MAHYIAELVLKAQQVQDSKKEEAEKACFRAILQLWEHRSSLPGNRPLGSFEPVFRALNDLRQPNVFLYIDGNRSAKTTEARNTIDLVKATDRAARGVLRWLVTQATLQTKKSDQKFAKSTIARVLQNGNDLEAANLLLDDTIILVTLFGKEKAKAREELTRVQRDLGEFIAQVQKTKNEIDRRLVAVGDDDAAAPAKRKSRRTKAKTKGKPSHRSFRRKRSRG